ncbi:MAG: hypothetical protein Q7S41_04300 [Candidatus Limnocylindria bacterium]|nr:hypothetical protein [Candidatus Limnocylindria bacterium]
MDIRPMAWEARIIEPSAAPSVTVILRVTYYSLEAICSQVEAERDIAWTSFVRARVS